MENPTFGNGSSWPPLKSPIYLITLKIAFLLPMARLPRRAEFWEMRCFEQFSWLRKRLWECAKSYCEAENAENFSLKSWFWLIFKTFEKKNLCQVGEFKNFDPDLDHVERAWQRGSGSFRQFSKNFVRSGKISEVKLDRVPGWAV